MTDSDNKINMTDNDTAKDPQALAQQVLQQASQGVPGGLDGIAAEAQTDPSTLQSKVQDAMSQGQQSGLLDPAKLQDGNAQEKVQSALESQGGSSAFVSKLLTAKNTPGTTPLTPYGNKAGNAIESALSPVGKPLGKGLETVSRPLGGIVEPLVGGLMKSGDAFGQALGVGSGNMDKRNEEKRVQAEELGREIGGKEATGENPLGL